VIGKVGVGFFAKRVWDALLVPFLAQNRFSMMTGRFVASSPDFF
jgi:hypothetical protein